MSRDGLTQTDGPVPAGAEDTRSNRTDEPVVLLEGALWKRLNEAATREEFAASWLALQCRSLDRAVAGLLMLLQAGGRAETAARWPEANRADGALRSAALLAIRERRGVVMGDPSMPNVAGTEQCIAYPVVVDEVVYGAVAVLMASGASADLRAVMRQIQWGVAWMRDWARRERAAEHERAGANSKLALGFLATVLESEGFQAAAVATVTELALLSGSERVSVGFRNRGSTVIRAISHSAQFGGKMDLVRMLAAAMDEATDQRSMILIGGPAGDASDKGEPLATRANQELARSRGGVSVLTVPVLVHDRLALAFTFERAYDRPFRQQEVELVTAIAAAVGPMLDEKRQNDRWIGLKILDACKNSLIRLAGPGYLGAKLGACAAVAVFTFFAFAHGDYRVNASARVEGHIRRAIVAPTDGFVKEASVRAGDTVKRGELLASLDDRDLMLERLRWTTERQQRELEYQNALAARERAKVNIIKSQIGQAEAQTKLIDEQLARAKFLAPFDALVVSGDLSQSISAAVTRGQVLFELTPLDAYRVDIYVDESQIADIEIGQRGTVLVSALPDESFPFTIEKITAVSEQRAGQNVFKVEGRLSEISPRLRPGMEGVAKVDIDNRRLIRIWTRSLVHWLRIESWRWLK
jgi:RND family efflux transporter MFP subunit